MSKCKLWIIIGLLTSLLAGNIQLFFIQDRLQRTVVTLELKLMRAAIRQAGLSNKIRNLEKVKIIRSALDNLADNLNESQRQNLAMVIHKECTSRNFDPCVILALLKTESNFRPKAVSHRGAKGIAQIKPATHKEICKRTGIDTKLRSGDSIELDIYLAISYLDMLRARFGSTEQALMAYCHGPTKLSHYLEKNRSLRKFAHYSDTVMAEAGKIRKSISN